VVHRLSETQRVALARALAPRPSILLLDEPFAAVDPATRHMLRRELRTIHAHEQVTTLQVTHDFDEALRLGDVVAVMADGRIAQLGRPDEVFRFPNSAFVARFIGTGTVLLGEVTRQAPADGDGPFAAWFDSAPLRFEVVAEREGPAHAVLRPEDLLLSREPPSSAEPVPAVVSRVERAGPVTSFTLTPGGPTAAVTTASAEAGAGSRRRCRDPEGHRHSSRVARICPCAPARLPFLFLGVVACGDRPQPRRRRPVALSVLATIGDSASTIGIAILPAAATGAGRSTDRPRRPAPVAVGGSLGTAVRHPRRRACTSPCGVGHRLSGRGKPAPGTDFNPGRAQSLRDRTLGANAMAFDHAAGPLVYRRRAAASTTSARRAARWRPRRAGRDDGADTACRCECTSPGSPSTARA
jgi:hypothetical protein